MQIELTIRRSFASCTEDGRRTGYIRFAEWETSSLETKSVKKGLKRFMELYPNIKVGYIPDGPSGEYYVEDEEFLRPS